MLNENVGYQLQFYRSSLMNLLLSFGPGLQQQGEVGVSYIVNVPTWLTQATYNLNINDITVFQEQLQNIASSLTVLSNSITSLNIKFYKKVAISLSYQFTYYSVPRPHTAQVTTITTISLIYPL